MATITPNVQKVFDEVLAEISLNVRSMMEELWLSWSHLGTDDATKFNNIAKLAQIEKDLHRDVLKETRQKLSLMQAQVDELKEETEELSKCLSLDITIMDYEENMMLVDYKKALEEQIVGYRQQVEQRRTKMERLNEWQRDLAEKLGVTQHEIKEVPLPSEEELDRLKEHLEDLQSERDKRAEIFLNAQVEIKNIMDKLQIKPQNKFEHTVVSSLSVDFKVTDSNMDCLAKLQQDLQEKYEQTNNRVLELRERLSKLWECLDEDHIYRENFLHAHPGCHPQTEAAIKNEIKRCEQLKKQKIQVFVSNIRTKIKLMWDNVMYSTEEREEFVYYFQDIFTEDTYQLHELYLEKITRFYNEYKRIFDLVATRKDLWLKMEELENRALEPGRYHNRGGQLLREEKERKTITNNLPKIEAQLRELVTEYEAKTGDTFKVDGKPLLEVIEEEWENKIAERQHKLSARKQALTPQTPSLRSMATSPLGKRNRTAAGLPATTEKTRPPSKRLLMTGSANKAATTSTSTRSALKRSAITTIKRRISGRLAVRALPEGKAESSKRKLDYGDVPKGPRVNTSIRHKRKFVKKRRSTSLSVSTKSSVGSSENAPPKDPLMETTLLTTYTDFKDGIIEKQISRSSLAVKPSEMAIPTIVLNDIILQENNTPTTPKTKLHYQAATTPRMGKEKIPVTPKINNMIFTPTRLTRSALKLDDNGFATPRPYQSATKLRRQNTGITLDVKTTPITMNRSKSHMHLKRVKDFPPLI